MGEFRGIGLSTESAGTSLASYYDRVSDRTTEQLMKFRMRVHFRLRGSSLRIVTPFLKES